MKARKVVLGSMVVFFVAFCVQALRAEVAIVRARGCGALRCTYDYGTGFSLHKLANGESLWLTAGHVVRIASSVELLMGRRAYRARILYRPSPSEPDIAILTARVPSLKEVYCLGPPVKRGDRVACNGFSHGGPALRSWDATVLLAASENGGYVRINTPFQQGDSGGPVFRNGKVVGLIVHNDVASGMGEFLPAATIAKFVKERTHIIALCQPVVPLPIAVPKPEPVPIDAPPAEEDKKPTLPPPPNEAIVKLEELIRKNAQKLAELEKKAASSDLSPVEEEIAKLRDQIANSKPPPAPDLTPIHGELQKTRQSLDAKIEKIGGLVSTLSPLVWWALGLGGTAATGGTAALVFAVLRTLLAARRRRKGATEPTAESAGASEPQSSQAPVDTEPRKQQSEPATTPAETQAEPPEAIAATQQFVVGQVPKDCPYLEISASTRSDFKDEKAAREQDKKAEPVVISSQTPPPPQAVIPETRFMPVERDTFAEAYDWAKQDFVRSYPGAATTFATLDSKIEQYLAAKGLKKGDAK